MPTRKPFSMHPQGRSGKLCVAIESIPILEVANRPWGVVRDPSESGRFRCARQAASSLATALAHWTVGLRWMLLAVSRIASHCNRPTTIATTQRIRSRASRLKMAIACMSFL